MRTSDMRIVESTDEAAIAAILDRSSAGNPDVEAAVAAIVTDVRRRGDEAVRHYAARFDGLDGSFEVSRAEMQRAARTVAPGVKRAIKEAARNIRQVAAKQIPRAWRASPAPGVTIAQRVTAL